MADEQDSAVATAGKRKYRKLNIERLPGETDDDYWRRHSREKMRIYRAEKAAGKPPYVAGPRKGQRRGSLTLPDEMRAELAQRPGESDADHKRRYQRAMVARYRAKNGEKEAARRRELYRLNGPGEKTKAWKAANKSKIASYARAHFDRNREAKLAKLLAWRDADPTRAKALTKAWFAKNRHKYTAYHAKRRAMATMATPLWVDWKAIDKVYYQAKKMTKKTGIEHQVDHIIPLNHPDVCGLHVPWNLQVITKAENIAKSNKLTLQQAA